MPVVVVAGCGRLDEIEAARLLAERLDEHLAGAAWWGSSRSRARIVYGRNPGPVIWPLLEVMAGIDVLVGSGGYNTVHEARATATSLVALARARKYDRQAVRLSPAECAGDEADVIRRVKEYLDRRSVTDRVVPAYVNGVHAAVEFVERLTACLRC